MASVAKARCAEGQQRPDGADIDGQHIAEQQGRRLRRIGGEEMQKQEAESQRKGEHEADRHIPLRQSFAHEAHADAAGDRHQHQAPERRNADEHGARRAGEADMGERMTGKGLAPQAPGNSRRCRRRTATTVAAAKALRMKS